jgi:hypothetical protein
LLQPKNDTIDYRHLFSIVHCINLINQNRDVQSSFSVHFHLLAYAHHQHKILECALANDSVVVILFLGLAKLSESHKITNKVSNVYIQLGKQEKIYYEIEYYAERNLVYLRNFLHKEVYVNIL